MKYRFRKNIELIPVNKPIVGQSYHVAWGSSRGVVGECVEVYEINKKVKMKSPKTRKLWNVLVDWKDLRHTRKNQVQNPH